MRHKLLTIAGSAMVFAVAAGGIGIASGQPAADRATLHFGVLFSDSFVDVGDPGPSAGDEIIANDRLTDASGAEVGHLGLVCTITDPSVPEAACQGTAVVPDGQITMQFLNSPPPVKIAAITGGTGRFRNARGYLRLEELPAQRGRLAFHLIG
jgi:hypothetical protein